MLYNAIRRKSRPVRVGKVVIGGEAPVAVQSMTNTDPHDFTATSKQIRELEAAGCDVVRITVPDSEAVDCIRYLRKEGISIPVVADIHFDYRLAIACAKAGYDKIRINPGNIGDESRVKEVCDACRERSIPIRIGVNSGSLEKNILKEYGAPTAEALCASALYNLELCRRMGFEDAVVSIKSSDVYTMITANRMLSAKSDCPIHIGVTEAGAGNSGLIKSAAGIGSLLCDGIGDTLRISLTDNPVREVEAARQLLNSLNMEGQKGLNIISCPTCGRTKIDLIDLVRRFEEAVRAEGLDRTDMTVALMGCVVNGPGEAAEADVGVAGGSGEASLFSHGKVLCKIPEDEIVPTLIRFIKENSKNTTE